MKTNSVGISKYSSFTPSKKKSIQEVFELEGFEFSEDIAKNLGIKSIYEFDGDDKTLLAYEAAKDVLDSANISPSDIDVIIDFSILPQKYVGPAWSMAKELQNLLGLKNAIAFGLGGTGASSSIVAIQAADALIRGDEHINNVLIVAGDSAINKNRVVGNDSVVSVLGDGSSAALVSNAASKNLILGSKTSSNGNFHDISYVPGGGLKKPTDTDDFVLKVDDKRYQEEDLQARLKAHVGELLDENHLELKDVDHFVFPNFSVIDKKIYEDLFEIDHTQKNCLYDVNRESRGHLQGNDLILNMSTVLESISSKPGDIILLASHGLGFTYAVTLIEV